MDYFISDTHFSHKNVITYENRPFEDTEIMDKVMIDNWNEKVKKEDIIYHLGDVAFASRTKIKEIINGLNGYKKLIRGNHDMNFSNTKWKEFGFDQTIIDGRSSSSYYLYEKDGYKLALSHYPIDNLPYFNIHGHVHSKIAHLDQTKHFCISVECIGYKPISWDELKLILENRKIGKE